MTAAADRAQDAGTSAVMLHGGPGAGREARVHGTPAGVCYSAGSAPGEHYTLVDDVYLYVGTCAWVHPGTPPGGGDG